MTEPGDIPEAPFKAAEAVARVRAIIGQLEELEPRLAASASSVA